MFFYFCQWENSISWLALNFVKKKKATFNKVNQSIKKLNQYDILEEWRWIY